MKGSQSSGTLRSGELARRAGVSADTLRVYERRGLLAPPLRARNGYRLYPAEAVSRVLLIQRALAFGFTLGELSRFLRDRDFGRPPCRDVRTSAEERLREVEATIAELEELKDSLGELIARWDAEMGAAAGKRAHGLLETLPSSLPRGGAGALSARRFARFPGKKHKEER